MSCCVFSQRMSCHNRQLIKHVLHPLRMRRNPLNHPFEPVDIVALDFCSLRWNCNEMLQGGPLPTSDKWAYTSYQLPICKAISMGYNSIFITIVGDPRCHFFVGSPSKISDGQCQVGSRWRTFTFQRGEIAKCIARGVCCLVLALLSLFVHPPKKNTEMLGSFALNVAEITRRLLPEGVYFAFSEKKNISHTKHHESKVHCHHPTPILGNAGKPTGSGQISVWSTR